MEKIPTAEEFFEEFDLSIAPIEYSNEEANAFLAGQRSSYNKGIEFAKLHVKAALEAASKESKLHPLLQEFIQDSWESESPINKDSILNAYPESNIK